MIKPGKKLFMDVLEPPDRKREKERWDIGHPSS